MSYDILLMLFSIVAGALGAVEVYAMRARAEHIRALDRYAEDLKKVCAVTDEATQIKEYADALNERCIADTAEIAKLREALIEAEAALEFACARNPQKTGFVPAEHLGLKAVRAALGA